MSDALTRLIERRKQLIEQAEQQRLKLANEAEPWRPTLARVDQGLAVARYLKGHPGWIVAAGVTVATIGHVRLWRWIGSGMVAWRMFSSLLRK